MNMTMNMTVTCIVLWYVLSCLGEVEYEIAIIGYESPRYVSYLSDSWLMEHVEIEVSRKESQAYPSMLTYTINSRRKSYFFKVSYLFEFLFNVNIITAFICRRWALLFVVAVFCGPIFEACVWESLTKGVVFFATQNAVVAITTSHFCIICCQGLVLFFFHFLSFVQTMH